MAVTVYSLSPKYLTLFLSLQKRCELSEKQMIGARTMEVTSDPRFGS